MSGKVRRIDFYPDEYVSGVGGVLRADEQGVYWMVCSLIMSESGPIKENHARIAGLCCIRQADARRIIDALVSKEKLTREDGKLFQKRAQIEVERASNRIQTASENGLKGGRPRRINKQNQGEEKAEGFSDEKLTTNHQPLTTKSSVEGARESVTNAVAVIEAFDAARIEHFGAALARPWPTATDRTTAERWLANGADLDLCRDVFHAGCARKAAARDGPPDSLKFFEKSVASAIAERSRPMPEGKPNGTGTRTKQPSSVASTAERRERLLRAVAGAVEPGRCGSG